MNISRIYPPHPVAGDDVEPLRKLCQEGVTLVLSHPACDAITALELDMIRRDTGARLGIHFPGYRHPALRRLAELVAAGDAAPLGRVEQLVVERVLEQRDRPHVLEQLARDASLIRVIIGTITRVSATAPTTDASAWSSISVQMTGRSGVLVRWSLEPGDAAQGGRLSLIGVAGRATLTMPATDDWRLEFTGSGSPPESFPTAEVTQAICQTLCSSTLPIV